MHKNDKKQNMKQKTSIKPSIDNDQLGENASGHPGQNEQYKKDKTK